MTESVVNKPKSRSGRRNRLRAKDLAPNRIREIKRAFDIHRNTLEVAQNFLLPRAEAVDGLLIQMDDAINDVRSQLGELRKQMGIADSSLPFLVRREFKVMKGAA